MNKCCGLTLSKSSTAGAAKPGTRIPPRVSAQRKFGCNRPAGGHSERFSNAAGLVLGSVYLGECVDIQDKSLETTVADGAVKAEQEESGVLRVSRAMPG